MTSRGEEKLLDLLQEYFPGKEIVKEYSFSNGLRLDFYLPELNLAFEFDGIQHSKYIDFFHENKSSFHAAQNKDEQKEWICSQLGINLIRIDFSEHLSLSTLDNKYDGPGDGIVQPEAEKHLSGALKAKIRQKEMRRKNHARYKDSDYYKAQLEKAKEYRRESQRKAKESKKQRDTS